MFLKLDLNKFQPYVRYDEEYVSQSKINDSLTYTSYILMYGGLVTCFWGMKQCDSFLPVLWPENTFSSFSNTECLRLLYNVVIVF